MTIELRLSDVDPPVAEPKRTIYRDIVNLPDPVKLGITVRYFNYDDVGLYMQITGSGTGYTFGTVNLGLLGSGSNAYINLDEFASKTKPSTGDLPNGELEENITLTLKAYTDSGYSTLKWTYERIVTVHWINSADAAFTVDELDNFDDGTVQGWAVANELGNVSPYPTIGVATDYVLSTSYSCKMRQGWAADTTADYQVRGRLYKSFTTPNKDVVYAIIDFRFGKWSYLSGDAYPYTKYQCKQSGTTILVYLGRPYDASATDYVPVNKWMRVVVPLPKNQTVEIRIVTDWCSKHGSSIAIGFRHGIDTYIDDFKIISK